MSSGRLKVGMKANISVQAKPGLTFTGELAAIAPEVDERNRHFQIDVRVPNDGRTLLSGMYASARIVEATSASAVVIPKEAVTSRDGKRVVFYPAPEASPEEKGNAHVTFLQNFTAILRRKVAGAK